MMAGLVADLIVFIIFCSANSIFSTKRGNEEEFEINANVVIIKSRSIMQLKSTDPHADDAVDTIASKATRLAVLQWNFHDSSESSATLWVREKIRRWIFDGPARGNDFNCILIETNGELRWNSHTIFEFPKNKSFLKNRDFFHFLHSSAAVVEQNRRSYENLLVAHVFFTAPTRETSRISNLKQFWREKKRQNSFQAAFVTWFCVEKPNQKNKSDSWCFLAFREKI